MRHTYCGTSAMALRPTGAPSANTRGRHCQNPSKVVPRDAAMEEAGLTGRTENAEQRYLHHRGNHSPGCRNANRTLHSRSSKVSRWLPSRPHDVAINKMNGAQFGPAMGA